MKSVTKMKMTLFGTGTRRTRRSTLVIGAILVHHGLTGVSAHGADLAGARADGLAMHGAGDAVVNLDVELGEFVIVDHARVDEVAKRALVDDVAHGEALNRFVLGRLAAAPIADHLPGVVSPVAITPVIATLDRHLDGVPSFAVAVCKRSPAIIELMRGWQPAYDKPIVGRRISRKMENFRLILYTNLELVVK